MGFNGGGCMWIGGRFRVGRSDKIQVKQIALLFTPLETVSSN